MSWAILSIINRCVTACCQIHTYIVVVASEDADARAALPVPDADGLVV